MVCSRTPSNKTPRVFTGDERTLWSCAGFSDRGRIELSENLCQGEDDLGLVCWGPPSFSGYQRWVIIPDENASLEPLLLCCIPAITSHRHWKGLEFLDVPFDYVQSDPDGIALHKESLSRLEYVDIHYAGYSKSLESFLFAITKKRTLERRTTQRPPCGFEAYRRL